jgi:hypothetical protein
MYLPDPEKYIFISLFFLPLTQGRAQVDMFDRMNRSVLEVIGQAALGRSLVSMAEGKDKSDYLVAMQRMKCVPPDGLTRTVLIVHPQLLY